MKVAAMSTAEKHVSARRSEGEQGTFGGGGPDSWGACWPAWASAIHTKTSASFTFCPT